MLDKESHRRKWRPALLLAGLALVVMFGAGWGSASTPPSGPLRVDFAYDFDAIDPALAYGPFSWQLEYATCAKLVNYPDAAHPEGSRLLPEIAAAMPTISADGRTWTFQIRDNYAFSPPATGVVTAASMKYTFERVAYGPLQSPGYQFMTNIVGAEEYQRGQANEITGIVAQGNTLTISLIEPQGEFLTFLAMPFFCAIPPNLPRTPITQAPIPSAGPYYISAYTPNMSLVASRNPNYTAPRPHRFDSIEYTIGHTLEEIRQRVESGVSDYTLTLPATAHQELAQLYGPGTPAAARGLQRWFSDASSCIRYLPLNNERPLFANANMRQAVNFAIDRTAMVAVYPATSTSTTDQYLPPGVPGFSDISAYPDHPDIARARQLANWQPGDPLRPGVLYYNLTPPGPDLAANIQQQLLQIGIDLTLVGFRGFAIYDAMGRRGEPFDLGTVGWCEDYHDPWNFMQLLDGTTIQPEHNNNLAYFNDPTINDRLHAARRLVADVRYAAFEGIEHDLVRDHAPWAAWGNPTDRQFFSERIGCQIHETYLLDLAALCLRPEITIDDVQVTEPATGTETALVTARLSSEMESQVTVDFATQDGTAHAGEDYVATSGTLTFAPHERTKTVSVTVNADSVAEPAETFSVNLSNESSGTMVDGTSTVTILDQPVGPPPPPPPGPPPPPQPPPPPPPQPPPPPPPPPPPVRRCVVPSVVGLSLGTARTRIRRAGCTVGPVRYTRSRRARGRVISQRPRARTRLARGGRVTLVVSRGRR